MLLVMFFDDSMFRDFAKDFESLSFFIANMEKEIKEENGSFCKMADYIAGRQNEMVDKLDQLNEKSMGKIYDRFFTKTTGDEVLVKKPKVVQLRRKTDKKMRGFTQLLDAIFSVTPFVNEMLCYLNKNQLGAIFIQNYRYYLAYAHLQMKVSDSSAEGYNICLARQLNIALKASLDPPENHSPLSNPLAT